MKPNWVAFILLGLANVAGFRLAAQETKPNYNGDIRKSSIITLAYRDAIDTEKRNWAKVQTLVEKDQSANFRVGEEEITSFGTDLDYGDLTGDGIEEAIIAYHYSWGVSGRACGVLVYTLKDKRPQLLLRIEGGDRAYGGIESAHTTSDDNFDAPCADTFGGVCVGHGPLKVARYRPTKTGCSACYGFIETTNYRWDGNKFVSAGAKTRKLGPGDAHFRNGN